jgi:hypothetical protein
MGETSHEAIYRGREEIKSADTPIIVGRHQTGQNQKRPIGIADISDIEEEPIESPISVQKS